MLEFGLLQTQSRLQVAWVNLSGQVRYNNYA